MEMLNVSSPRNAGIATGFQQQEIWGFHVIQPIYIYINIETYLHDLDNIHLFDIENLTFMTRDII